jgi:prolyl-tRNA editing enzyme YbaK/EbsC (Cys-tRNA(Pro) deacylase)
MPISKKIIKYLEENKYKYEIVPHKTTFTAWDVSQTKKVKPQEVVKSLVLKLDKDYFLALLSANRNLNKQKFLKTVNAEMKKIGEKTSRKVDFAKEPWMKKNLPGKVGAVPPFGKILKLRLFVDSLLLKNKALYLGSGEYTSSIKVGTKQYLKIEQPVKGTFSENKK